MMVWQDYNIDVLLVSTLDVTIEGEVHFFARLAALLSFHSKYL